MTLHEQYDPARWVQERNQQKRDGRWWFSTADGPGMCELLDRRQQMEKQLPLGRKVPCDIFVMQPGPAPDRAMTNIHGLPYRPASLPWPRSPFWDDPLPPGRTLRQQLDPDSDMTDEEFDEDLRFNFEDYQFFGQFNFADSRDLVGKLPGDVLLLFGKHDCCEVTHYEWQPLGLTDLIRPEQVPHWKDEEEFGPETCYGQILRTYDYPDAESDERDDYEIFCWNATRIGGKPYYAQGGAERQPGRFLCCLHGLPNSDVNLYIHIEKNDEMHSRNECT